MFKCAMLQLRLKVERGRLSGCRQPDRYQVWSRLCWLTLHSTEVGQEAQDMDGKNLQREVHISLVFDRKYPQFVESRWWRRAGCTRGVSTSRHGGKDTLSSSPTEDSPASRRWNLWKASLGRSRTTSPWRDARSWQPASQSLSPSSFVVFRPSHCGIIISQSPLAILRLWWYRCWWF